jgi:hypothetical protein
LILFKGQRIAPKASFTDRSRRCAGKSSVYDRRIKFPTSVADTYVGDEDGRLPKVGTFTPEENLKYLVEREIGFEIAGQTPPMPAKTWREHSRQAWGPINGSTEFRTYEQVRAYIEQRGHARVCLHYDAKPV